MAEACISTVWRRGSLISWYLLAWLRRTYPATYYVCQTWRLVNACVPRQRRRSSSRRHAFLPPVTALSTWLWREHGTACRDLSHRYLHWRPLDVSRRQLFSRSFPDLDSSVPTIASDRYSVLTLRRTRVLSLSLAFVRCPCSLLTLRHLNRFFL